MRHGHWKRHRKINWRSQKGECYDGCAEYVAGQYKKWKKGQKWGCSGMGMWSSSFVYHRLIMSTHSVGAMLWSMAQLRKGQLRMVVDIVGSCWWCDQLSVLARHTHMMHCPPVPTSSWMLCTDRLFAVCLESSNVFDSDLLPWRLLLGPIRGDVLGLVLVRPTPASTLPQEEEEEEED